MYTEIVYRIYEDPDTPILDDSTGDPLEFSDRSEACEYLDAITGEPMSDYYGRDDLTVMRCYIDRPGDDPGMLFPVDFAPEA